METQEFIPAVALDTDTTQTFAEIEVQWGIENHKGSSVLIRGLEGAKTYEDAAAPALCELTHARCATIVGGGVLRHDSATQEIFVFGYSLVYRRGHLARMTELCREAYPGYRVIWCARY